MIKPVKIFALNVVSLFIILYIGALAWSLLMVTTPHCDNDFKTFCLSLIEHRNPYQISQYVRVIHVEKHQHKTTFQTSPPITSVNMNTPLMNVFLKFILHISAKLSVTTGLYLLLSACFTVISIVFLLSYFSISWYYALPFSLLLWLSWPALYNLKLGQVSFFLLPLWALAFYLQSKKAYAAMAVILGMLASLKLFFVIFLLFFLLRRDWRNTILFLLSFLIFFFSPLIYFHWSDFHAFFQMAETRQLFLDRSTLPMNGSILGLVINIANRLHIIPSQNQITLSAGILCLYALIRWVIYDAVFLRNLPQFQNELRLSFLMVLALFCSPLAWLYYFLLLLIPLAVMIKISQEYVLSKWFYVFLMDALILLYFPYSGKAFGLAGFLTQFSVFFSLLCWLFALNIAAQAVDHGETVQSSQQQPTYIIGIFSVYALLSVTLLSFNFGMPYFLIFDKSHYLKTTAPVLWLPIKG